MTLLNPAKYQQVLQKMPDPQLMELLKRPDKIPSQFVIQEINRRKQMRQAEQARKQQVANAVAMQQQQPVQTTTPEGQPVMGMKDGGASDESVGSAKEVLAMELRMQKEFSRPVGDEKAPPFYGGMSDVFFNEKGVPKKVSGAMEMKKAIDEGFVFTRDDADKFPAPPISREEKIFKRSNNILESYARGGGALLQDTDEKAKNYIKELEALNKLSPNYDPIVSSASGMIRTLVPRSETADGLLDRLAGGYDIKVEYDPSKNENLPKPKPKMAEGGITTMGMSHGGPPPHPPFSMTGGASYFTGIPSAISKGYQSITSPFNIMGGLTQAGKQRLQNRGKDLQKGFEAAYSVEPIIFPSSDDPDNLGNLDTDLDTGIKSIENNTNDNVDNNEPIDDNAIEKGKKSNSQLDKLVASLGSQINDQIAKTKEPFLASSVLQGFKQSEFFDQTSEAYKKLNARSKERIDAANQAGIDLIKERQKYAAQLEKEGRTPENIVFESLISMGLDLMASPEANFTQALGNAGKTGFATFQNLRKEQKDLVKEKHKRAYEIAEAEYKHKMSISQLENELDVQKVNAATTINNLARTEKKDFIDQRKIEFEMENLKQGLALEKQKLKLDQTTKGIAAFLSLNDEERKDKTLELKEDLNEAQIKSLTEDKSEFAQLVKIGTSAGLKKEDIVNSYLESKFGGTEDEDVIKAVAGIAKTLAQDVSFDDTEDVEGYLLNLNKIAKDIFGITQDITSGKSFDIAKNKVTG